MKITIRFDEEPARNLAARIVTWNSDNEGNITVPGSYYYPRELNFIHTIVKEGIAYFNAIRKEDDKS
jgi:hypothetical protein